MAAVELAVVDDVAVLIPDPGRSVCVIVVILFVAVGCLVDFDLVNFNDEFEFILFLLASTVELAPLSDENTNDSFRLAAFILVENGLAGGDIDGGSLSGSNSYRSLSSNNRKAGN